jgi:hypothetical protein
MKPIEGGRLPEGGEWACFEREKQRDAIFQNNLVPVYGT